jgi:hypothetical protein
MKMRLSFYSSRTGIFGKASHHPGLFALLQLSLGSLRLVAFPKAKLTVEREDIYIAAGNTYYISVQKLFLSLSYL